jgi:signal transduction histidine kinase
MARRRTRPLQSVRVRITLAAVLVTAVAVGTAGWRLVRSVENAQVRDIRNNISAFLDQVAGRLAEGQGPQQAVAANDAPGPARVKVTNERGQTIVLFPEFVLVGGRRDEPVAVDIPAGGEVILAESETVTRTVETAQGELTITADAPVDQIARNVDALTERLAVGLPALVALVGVIAWVLVGRALRPVEAMRAEAERITGSTMHRRVPEPPTNDEIGRLARTMNTMLDRLETAAAQQRRFVSDASHELRSPITALRAGLEVARANPGPAGWPARVDSLLAEECRLESLLDDLLLLAAHDEHDTTAPPARSVNMTALAIEEGRRPRRVPVHVVQTPADNQAVVVAGVQQQLARALSNMVDNAARHAASVVQISLSTDGDTVRVAVDDDGPGIHPADRERVFERFTRLDDGRARHDGGSGLGLAVVRSILTGHHGTVRIDDSPLGGARFVAELPALPS